MKHSNENRINRLDNLNYHLNSEDRFETSTDTAVATKIEIQKNNSHSENTQLAVLNNGHNDSAKVGGKHDTGIYTNRINSASNIHTRSDVYANKDSEVDHRSRVSYVQFDLEGCKPINEEEQEFKTDHEKQYIQALDNERTQYKEHIKNKKTQENNQNPADKHNHYKDIDINDSEILIHASPVINMSTFNDEINNKPMEISRPVGYVSKDNNSTSEYYEDKRNIKTINSIDDPTSMKTGIFNVGTADISPSNDNEEHIVKVRYEKRNSNPNLVNDKIKAETNDCSKCLKLHPTSTIPYNNEPKSSFNPTLSSKCDVRLSITPIGTDFEEDLYIDQLNCGLANNSRHKIQQTKHRHKSSLLQERRNSDCNENCSTYVPTTSSKIDCFLNTHLVNKSHHVDEQNDKRKSNENGSIEYGNNKTLRRVDEMITLIVECDNKDSICDEISIISDTQVKPQDNISKRMDLDYKYVDDSFVNYIPSGYMDSLNGNTDNTNMALSQQVSQANIRNIKATDVPIVTDPTNKVISRVEKDRIDNNTNKLMVNSVNRIPGKEFKPNLQEDVNFEENTFNNLNRNLLPEGGAMRCKQQCQYEQDRLSEYNQINQRNEENGNTEQKFNIFIDIKPTSDCPSQVGELTELVVPLDYSQCPSYNVRFGIKPSTESRRSHSTNSYRKPNRDSDEYKKLGVQETKRLSEKNHYVKPPQQTISPDFQPRQRGPPFRRHTADNRYIKNPFAGEQTMPQVNMIIKNKDNSNVEVPTLIPQSTNKSIGKRVRSNSENNKQRSNGIHGNMTNYIGDIIYNDSRMFKKDKNTKLNPNVDVVKC